MQIILQVATKRRSQNASERSSELEEASWNDVERKIVAGQEGVGKLSIADASMEIVLS